MRILLGAFGTRGDIQPMLALTQVLSARGHEVTLVVSPSSLELAREVLPGALTAGMRYEEVARLAATGRVRDVVAAIPLLRGEMVSQLQVLEPLAASVDMVVGSSVFAVGALLAERFHLPYVYCVFCSQLIPSGEHPSPLVRRQDTPRWVNRLSWVVNEWIWGRVLRPLLIRARRERGLGPLGGGVWSSLVGHHPVVCCDPALAPAPSDWRTPILQPGALFLLERGELSPEVSSFLERGPPPVYVGFGSMGDRNPRDTTQRLLESIRRAGVRALISRGWAGFESDVVPPDVLFIGSEPHGKLFPRCAAVVHHGGAGTTHAAARAGVPQVVVPHILDQFYWAHRVVIAGVSPATVHRQERDPEPLARAIRACVSDAALRQRARALASRLVTDGADRVAQALERLATEAGIPVTTLAAAGAA